MIAPKLSSWKGRSLAAIREAFDVDLKGRTARVCIISEGLGNLKDKNFYSEDAIRSAQRVFEGKRFFVDHPSKSEEDDRPERSVRDLAGYFYGCQLGETQDPETGEKLKACYANLKFAESEPGNLALGQVVAALEYQKRFPNSKEVYCGISINGGGMSHPATIKGMEVNVVTEIQEAFSADIVTMPARGGKFLAMIQESFKTGEPLKASGSEQAAGGGQKGDKMKDQKKEAAKSAPKKAGGKAVTFTEAYAKTLSIAARVVKEAGAKVTKLKEDEAAEAKMRLGRLGERMKHLAAALAAPKADPQTIAADIKQDLEELLQATGMAAEGAEAGYEDETMPPALDTKQDAPMKQQLPADKSIKPEDVNPDLETEGAEGAEGEEEEARVEGEETGEEEAAEGYERKEEETMAGEEEGAEGAETHDDTDLGMDDGDDLDQDVADVSDEDNGDEDQMDDEEDDEEEDEARMRFKCAKCNEDNVVLPPKGMKLVASEAVEAAREAAAYKETVARLQRNLEAKEARMTKQNVKVKETATEVEQLQKENRKLKAENIAMKRISEAKKALREAEVPGTVLTASDLVQFEPHQWPAQIKLARKAVAANEKAAYGDGNRGGEVKMSEQQEKDAAEKALAKFSESYNG